jgi:hypothetical protein
MVKETNGLIDANAFHNNVTYKIERTLYWSDPELKRITRLRLVSDPGYPVWDVSYCTGEDTNGNPVDVQVPFSELPKGKGAMVGEIVRCAKQDNVYAKGLGIFNGVISTLI